MTIPADFRTRKSMDGHASANAAILAKAQALVQAGAATDMTTALGLVAKSFPELWTRRQQEFREPAPPRTFSKALDVNQRPPYGQTPSGAPPPAGTPSHAKWAKVCQEIQDQHPEWNAMQVDDEADRRLQGQALFAQHRDEHYARAGRG